MRIWVDVEDLFEYALHNKRPSGIQRLEFELSRALQAVNATDATVHFVRHDSSRQSFYVTPWQAVERLFDDLTNSMIEPAAAAQATPSAAVASGARIHLREFLRTAVYRLPASARHPLIQAFAHQRAALGFLAAFLRVAFGAMIHPLARRQAIPRQPVRRQSSPAVATAEFATEAMAVNDPNPLVDPFDTLTMPGDTLLVLGSPWFHPNYARLVTKAKCEKGLRFAVLVYDLIPIRRPEWCDQGLIRIFTHWTNSVLPLADVILTISRASAIDVAAYLSELAVENGIVPRPIPIGTGFHGAAALPESGMPSRAPPPNDLGRPELGRPLPPAGSYALVVSTIEARKNHVLLFRLWRRLLGTLPHHLVPTLVLAGRIGWLIADLIQQLHNAAFLDGKIVVIENPTDAELKRLYAGCLFTVFPSFYEGWGLPVSESLAFGRPCFASNATSLPEAGGNLARYFDPKTEIGARDDPRHTRKTGRDRPVASENRAGI